MWLIKWLKKPYFFIDSLKFKVSLGCTLGCFIFLFMWIFKPFGMHEVKNNHFYYSLGFGLITLLNVFYIFIVIPKIFKNYFSNENWTVGKNILFILGLISHISFFNWVYNNQVQIPNSESSLISLLEMIAYTFSIGVFPTIIFTYLSEKYYSDKRKKTSNNIMKSKKIDVVKTNNKKVFIEGYNKKENISFMLNDLVYISSEGNYINIFLNTENGIKNMVLRITLTKALSTLNDYYNIIKCHKSYIINTNYITSIYGNARGYFLKCDKISNSIPVSRSFNKNDLQKLIH